MSFTRSLRGVGSVALAGALLFGAAPGASADQIRDDQWPLQAFQAEKVWQESTGEGVTVAVLDNGVDGSHPDLTGSVLPGKDFVNGGRGDRATGLQHGTAMASLIAGHGHGAGGQDGVKGLAPDAKILPVTVLETDGESGVTEGNLWHEGLRYAVDNGATVVNMSFADFSLNKEEEAAIAYAAEKDVLMIAGSGNDRSENEYFPAAAPGVVAVGAISNNGEIWKDSNYGPHLMLSAPGVNIRSAGPDGQYRQASGTSDATAYVSAAAALLRAKFPDLTAGQIVNRLTQTATVPSGGETPDPRYGYGFIRPYSALTEDIPAGPVNGPLKQAKGAEQQQDSSGQGSSGQDSSGQGEEAADDRADDAESTFSGPVLALLGAGGLVVLVVIIVLVLRSRRNRSGPPSGGWGGPSPTGQR